MKKMRNVKLTLAYDGTFYHGFQTQKGTGLKTVQETLEEVLNVLTKEKVIVYGSGRTDSGVHAQGQVVNFFTESRIPVEKIPLAINALLPKDIIVHKAEDMGPDFHARFSAKRKTYRYRIYNERHLSPFERFFSYHIPVLLDVEGMNKGSQAFLGTHNFQGFCAKDATVDNYVRTIYRSEVKREGPVVVFTVEGSGFLYNMVRIMIGTLIEIGQHKRSPADISVLLQAGERKLSGMTVPPQGLFLWAVEY